MAIRLWALSALAFSLALAMALGPLDALPHVTDEIAYSLQARLLATGAVMGPAQGSPSMILFPFVAATPGLHGVFPPGWPMLLALGFVVAAPWLVNPLLAAAMPPLMWKLGRNLTNPRTAWLAALVVALSPGFLVLAASRMAQTSVLVALTAMAVMVTLPRATRRTSLAMGLLLAYLVLARPYDALVLGLPLVGWQSIRGRRPSWIPLLLLPAICAGLLLLWYNRSLTGDPFTFPATAWYQEEFPQRPHCNELGFGVDKGCYSASGQDGYDVGDALGNLWHSLVVFDRLLLGLPGGGLLALAGLFLLPGRGRLLTGILLLLPPAYMLYWSPGFAYGARFYHPLYVLAPLALAALLARLLKHWYWLPVPLASALGLWLASRELGDRYWCVDGSLRQAVEDLDLHGSVLLLEARGTRATAWPYLGVQEFTCDPLLESGDAFALTLFDDGDMMVRHKPSDAEQTAAFLRTIAPGRPAWLLRQRVDLDKRWLSPLDPLTGSP